MLLLGLSVRFIVAREASSVTRSRHVVLQWVVSVLPPRVS